MLNWLRDKVFGRRGVEKSAPAGLGPSSLGDAGGSAYLDAYRRVRQPTRPELIQQYRNAVYVCANLNAQGVAGTPMKLYVQTGRKQNKPKCYTKALDAKTLRHVKTCSAMTGRVRGDANVEEVPEHPLLDLLTKPNPYMSWTDLSVLTSLYLDIVGSAFWFIGDRNRLGQPAEIWPVPAHQCFPWRRDINSDELITAFLFTSGRKQIEIPPEDIVHFKLANLWEPYSMGYSPLHAVWEPVNVTEKHYSHMQNLLDNQARPDALLTPDTVIGEPERQRLETRLNNKFRAGGFGGVMVTEESMKLTPIGWSPLDLGVFESFGITKDMICDAFGVPQALTTKDTNLANLQASLVQHGRMGILPRVRARDEVINRYLIPLYDDTGRLFVCSDSPVPDDDATITTKVTALVGGGIWTPNEGRAATGKEPEPWGEAPRVPGTSQVADKTTGKPDAPPASGPVTNVHVAGGKDGKKGTEAQGGNASPKAKKKPKKKGKNVAKLYEAVKSAGLPLPVAFELVRKDAGMRVAIAFEEAAKAIPAPEPAKAEEKDIDTSAMARAWALSRLDAIPAVGIGDMIPVPFPVALDPYPDAQKFLTREEWQSRPVAQFIVRDLVATQPTVERGRVRELILTPAQGKLPRVVISGQPSRHYLDGGHHHATAAWLMGRTEIAARFAEAAPQEANP